MIHDQMTRQSVNCLDRTNQFRSLNKRPRPQRKYLKEEKKKQIKNIREKNLLQRNWYSFIHVKENIKCKFRHCKRSLASVNYFIYPRLFLFSIIFKTNLDYSFVDHPIEEKEIEDEIDLSAPHLPKYGKTRWWNRGSICNEIKASG